MALPVHRTAGNEAFVAAEAALLEAGIAFTVVDRCSSGHCPVCGPSREASAMLRPQGHPRRSTPERPRPMWLVTPGRARQDR